MLVLSTKIGKSVVIADAEGNVLCTISACNFDRGYMQIGFDAPKNIGIYRDSVWKKMVEEGTTAKQTPAALDALADSIVEKLDDYARTHDPYEYGLPMTEDGLQNMRTIVKRLLLERESDVCKQP